MKNPDTVGRMFYFCYAYLIFVKESDVELGFNIAQKEGLKQ